MSSLTGILRPQQVSQVSTLLRTASPTPQTMELGARDSPCSCQKVFKTSHEPGAMEELLIVQEEKPTELLGYRGPAAVFSPGSRQKVRVSGVGANLSFSSYLGSS